MSGHDPSDGGFDPLANDLPPVGSQPLGPAAEQILAERYELGDKISGGAIGAVYDATDKRTGRAVVVKIMKWWEDDVRKLARFRREALAARDLQHPNIVDVLDINQSDGVQFFVMEKLDGSDLAALLKDKGQLPLSQIRTITAGLVSALKAVHAAGIVHRDVKPGNVIVVDLETEAPIVKLIDFGVAKLIEGDQARLTGQRQILGGLGYMPPEQAGGKSSQVDARADIYALAAVVYRMVVGKPPVEGRNVAEFAANIFTKRPTPPSHLAAVPTDLDDVLLKALEKSADDRYPSIVAFWDALDPVLQ